MRYGVLGFGVLILLINEYPDSARRFKDREGVNVLDRIPVVLAAIEDHHARRLNF